MREIRIWDGNKYHYPEANENETNHHLQIGSNGFFSLWDGEGNFITSSEKGGIIEWSTGILDKNENKIFEGDIVRNVNDQSEAFLEDSTVEWHPEISGFVLIFESIGQYKMIGLYEELEVAGSIHQSLTPNK
ncbi:hypothetical protein CMV04_12295 [Elizabethkingia anophelis]|nr:hypothetical protein [Elizabethkingia anophelis]